jgi:hypothetical protein
VPTRRTPLNRSQHARIGPEAVRLWRLIVEITESDAGERWEEDEPAGRRREMLDAEVALISLLGLSPWHYLPSNVSPEGPPQPWQDPERHALAQQLRRALEAAAAE